MNYPIQTVFVPIAGFIAGGLIGIAFGAVQRAAKEKNRGKQAEGKFSGPWIVIPGSMTRIALFMMVLTGIQIGLPLLFKGPVQWIVTAGVVLGYGWTLLKEYRHRATVQ